MELNEVPQEGNVTLAGGRKAVYARDEQGQMVLVPCPGWEVEEIVTLQAVDALQALADDALKRGRAGLASPLEYWMYAQRMDLTILAQSVGLWRWRVRRHLQPARFARLSAALLAQYAEALGLPVDQLKTLP